MAENNSMKPLTRAESELMNRLWDQSGQGMTINQLVELYPDSAVAFAARGGMEAERNMLELAEYDYSEAIRLDPANTDYIINRVDVRLRMGKKKEAREDLDDAVKAGIPRPALVEFYARCKE